MTLPDEPSYALTPFQVPVDDDDLHDLRARLRRIRWPEPEVTDDWSQGVPRSYMEDLCDHWLHSYHWRQVEAS